MNQPATAQGRTLVLTRGSEMTAIRTRSLLTDATSARAERGEPASAEDSLHRDMEAFLLDRQARGLSPRSVDFYRQKLAAWLSFLEGEGISRMEGVTAEILRKYLLHLAETHAPGGVHAAYRALRAFFSWYESEEEREGWRNPLKKVRAPKVPTRLLEPVPMEHVKAMARTCKRGTFHGDRDGAVLLCLLDSGCRAGEFLDLNMEDVDLPSGQLLVRCGKNKKPRAVFLGAKSRRATARYLRRLGERREGAAVWVTREGTRLSYEGLRDIVRRRASKAGVPSPTLHQFRRACALACLRAGMDPFSLQRLLGHSSLAMVRLYLDQTVDDVKTAHQRYGPVDHLW